MPIEEGWVAADGVDFVAAVGHGEFPDGVPRLLHVRERIEALVRRRGIVAIAMVDGIVHRPTVAVTVAAIAEDRAAVGEIARMHRSGRGLEVDVHTEGRRRAGRNHDVVERGEALRAIVVRGHPQTDESRRRQGDRLGADVGPNRAVGRDGAGEDVARTPQADPIRRGVVRSCGVGARAAGADAALERSAIARRHRSHDVPCAGGGVLADHHARLGPDIRRIDGEHARDDFTVAIHGLLDEVKGIRVVPDVIAGPLQREGARGVSRVARQADIAHVHALPGHRYRAAAGRCDLGDPVFEQGDGGLVHEVFRQRRHLVRGGRRGEPVVHDRPRKFCGTTTLAPEMPSLFATVP